jgi:broad specificity phosphatase PhoE
MSKIEVLVFRHGETDWNRQRRFQGHTDIPLNELGREQAKSLAPLLEKHSPEIILSSDLSRAKETAEIANTLVQVPILLSPAIRECRLGDPEGLERDVVFAQFGELAWERWLSTRPEDRDFSFPNGERKSDHLARMTSYLESFFHENPHYQRMAVSTHGGSLRRLVHHCAGAPEEPVAIPNCVLYRLSFDRADGSWRFHGLP